MTRCDRRSLQRQRPLAGWLLAGLCLAGSAPVLWAEGPANFVTPTDTIPNFAQSPTIQSVRDGAWSEPSTWDQGRPPTSGDIALVRHAVVYDSMAGIAQVIGIDAGGALRFRTDLDTKLAVGTVLVMPGGLLEIGTATTPVAPAVTAELIIRDLPLDLTDDGVGVFDPKQYGAGLLVIDGTVRMHGALKQPTFVRLAQEPQAGDATLELAEPVAGWKIGDRLFLPDTRQLASWGVPPETRQWEEAVISGISADGLSITLEGALQFAHGGARDADGTVRFLPHVANLSRNVVIRSENPAGTRGCVLALHRALLELRAVQLADLGRTTTAVFDNTVMNADGTVLSIGTNQRGRDALSLTGLIGPSEPPASGAQFTVEGAAILGSPRWGLALFGSHYGLIRGNVIDQALGAGIVMVKGSESFTVIERNLVTRGLGSTPFRLGEERVEDCGVEGTGYWLRGAPNNVVRDNVAANMRWIGYGTEGIDSARVPLFPGAAVSGPTAKVNVTYQSINMQQQPFREFARNEVYASANGIFARHTGPMLGNPETVPERIVKEFRAWHVRTGFFDWQINGWTFDGWVQRGDPAVLATGQNTIGFDFSDYYVRALRIVRADIQNLRTGIHVCEQPGDPRESMGRNQPPTVIEDSVMTNVTNISLPSLHAGNGNAAAISPRQVIIRNVKFGVPSAPFGKAVPRSIAMTYVPQTTAQGRNYLQRDDVDVEDYNQQPGVDFQVFYREQRPDFVVPQGGLIIGSQGVVAAPEAGLTNQQTWERYDVAIAGAIAPCADETTYPEILGYVCPTAPRAPLDVTAPGVPTSLNAVPRSSTSVRLSWTPSTDDRRFIIYSLARSGLFTLTGSNISSFEDTGLLPGTAYTYTLYAYDAGGNRSSGSAKVTVMTPTGVSIPGDLTGEGIVSLADVRLMIEMMIGAAPVDLTRADLTADGQLSLADLRALLLLLIG